MKHTINPRHKMTLLTFGIVLCLGATAAQGQRGARLGGHVFANQASVGQSTANQASANQTSGCMSGSSSQTSSTSTTAQSGSASTTMQSNAVSLNARSSQVPGVVSAQRTAANQLRLQWAGNTSNVQRVYLGVVDASGRVLAQQAITQLPVQASLTLTPAARYYGVQVVYSDGTTRTTYSPIR